MGIITDRIIVRGGSSSDKTGFCILNPYNIYGSTYSSIYKYSWVVEVADRKVILLDWPSSNKRCGLYMPLSLSLALAVARDNIHIPQQLVDGFLIKHILIFGYI